MLLSRTRKIALTLLCAAQLISLSVQPLRAQIDMGGVTGTIKDPTGALVPGAAGFSKITTLRNNPRLVQLALKLYF
jgi:hypothetical protein